MEAAINYRIAFIGPAQTGKTTAATYCADKWDGVVNSFAAALKYLAQEVCWDGYKDEKGRRFLQEFGCAVRNYNEDFWVNELLSETKGAKYSIFIDDCRFPNEARILKENGYTLVRIIPFDFDLSEDWRTHESETALDGYEADYNIVSYKGDLEGLYISLDQLLEKIDDAN